MGEGRTAEVREVTRGHVLLRGATNASNGVLFFESTGAFDLKPAK